MGQPTPPHMPMMAAKCSNTSCSSYNKERVFAAAKLIVSTVYQKTTTNLFCGDCGTDLTSYNPTSPNPLPAPPSPNPDPPKPFPDDDLSPEPPAA